MDKPGLALLDDERCGSVTCLGQVTVSQPHEAEPPGDWQPNHRHMNEPSQDRKNHPGESTRTATHRIMSSASSCCFKAMSFEVFITQQSSLKIKTGFTTCVLNRGKPLRAGATFRLSPQEFPHQRGPQQAFNTFGLYNYISMFYML